MVHHSGGRRFSSLLRENHHENEFGTIVTPLHDAALSPQGHNLVFAQMTATTVLPAVANRIDLAAGTGARE